MEPTQESVKQVIKNSISEKIDFRTLRQKMPDVSRKNLKLLVFEVMSELKVCEIPFEGMLSRRETALPLLPVAPNGWIDVSGLLSEKNFTPDRCKVHYSIGPKKITLTIKPTYTPPQNSNSPESTENK